MSMLPGLGRPSLGGWASLSYDCNPSPAPQPQVTPVQPFPSASMSAPPITSSLDFVTPIPSSQASQYNAPRHHSIQLDQPPITLPMHPAPQPPPPVSIERAAPLAVERGGPFRPSMYELEPGFGFSSQAQPFQTSIFRKYVSLMFSTNTTSNWQQLTFQHGALHESGLSTRGMESRWRVCDRQ